MTRSEIVEGFKHFTPPERDKVYRRALERCGIEGVRKLEHDIRLKIEQRMAGGSLALRKAFKYFDKDNSGDIDPDEFLAAMDWFGLQFTEDCVMALYGIYDTDRGGSLGYAEFVDQLLDGMADRGAPPGLAVVIPKKQLNLGIKDYRLVTPAQAIKAFTYVDHFQTGRIELSELDTVLTCLGMHIDSDMVNDACCRMDTKNTGEIDFGTFWEWWENTVSAKSPVRSQSSLSKSSNSERFGITKHNLSSTQSLFPSSYSGRGVGANSPSGRVSPWGGSGLYSTGRSSPANTGSLPHLTIPKWAPPMPGSPIRRA